MDKGTDLENRTNRKKILIVDDETSVRRTLERTIKRIQGDCSQATSAEEARRILKQKPFELVLCDIRLPGESGIDLVGHILLEHPETAVIMVSGVEDPEVVEKALEIGAYGYIIKPFRTSEVIINISSALRRQRLEMESRMHREELEQMVENRTIKLQETLDGIIQVVAHTVESRSKELGEKRIVAENNNDFLRIEKIDWEVKEIEDRLKKDVGHNSKPRVYKNPSDTKRNKIGRSITRALNEIKKHDPEAHRHFSEAIEPYSSQLCYNPREDIEWHLG